MADPASAGRNDAVVTSSKLVLPDPVVILFVCLASIVVTFVPAWIWLCVTRQEPEFPKCWRVRLFGVLLAAAAGGNGYILWKGLNHVVPAMGLAAHVLERTGWEPDDRAAYDTNSRRTAGLSVAMVLKMIALIGTLLIYMQNFLREQQAPAGRLLSWRTVALVMLKLVIITGSWFCAMVL